MIDAKYCTDIKNSELSNENRQHNGVVVHSHVDMGVEGPELTCC